MGWFDFNTGDADVGAKSNDGIIYKMVQLFAIVVLVAAVAIIIFEVCQVFTMNSTANGIVISAGILGVGGLNALPWVRIFERVKDMRFKIVALVFLALIGVCVILWIVCVFQIIGLINSGLNGEDDEIFAGVITSLNTIRVVIIVSLQFMILSGIAMNFVKYRTSLLVYQAMNGVACLYMDFYISLLLTAFTVTTAGDVIISPTAEWVISPILGALFLISLVVIGVVGTVFQRTDRRRLITTANDKSGSNG